MDTGHNIFVNSTPVNFHNNAPSRHTSCTSNVGRQWDTTKREDRLLDRRDHVAFDTHADTVDFQTVKWVLDVLKEGRMDVCGFLNALCWGNRLAITDPTTRSARTSLTHNDQLSTVVSCWLHPPRTTQGGSTAGGARQVLLPLVISTVKEVINEEMDAVVEDLKEESVDVTEQSVLGTVIDEVQEKVRLTAPVFYDLVKTAAWSEKQEERNRLKDPTKASVCYEFGSQRLIQTNL